MSEQSFDRLFTSGPMLSALAVMHCFGNLASVIFLIRLRIVAYEPENLWSCPPQLRRKNLGWNFILSF